MLDVASALRSRLAWRCLVLGAALAIQGGAVLHRYSPNRWLYRDGAFYFNTVRGLVENRSLDQGQLHPRSWFNGRLGWNYNLTDDWSNVSVGRGGTWYPKQPLLMPILSVPFYLAFGAVGTLLFNLLCGVLGALLAAELAARYTARWAASLLAIGLSATPVLVEQAYGFNNDVFYSLFIVGAALCLAEAAGPEHSREDDGSAGRAVGRAGLLAGLAVLAKVTNVFFLVPFAIWAMARGRPSRPLASLVRFALASAVGVGLAALANWILFGAPWITAYHRVLVVQAGHMEIQPHTRLFHRDFWEGLAALWWGPRAPNPQAHGLWHTFPLYPLALAGCLAIGWRRRFAEAAALFLALAWPLLFFAKYDWFRDDFLDPVYLLSAAPLAAWLGLLLRPRREPPESPVLWRRGLALGAAVLALCAGGRAAVAFAQRGPYRLVDHVPEAQVFLGEIPCDYFNNQVDRWECAGFDRGTEWLMTGLTLDGPPRFGGVPRRMILLDPHPERQPRRLRFELPLGRSLTLLYGLPDGASPLPVELTASVAGVELAHVTQAAPGLQRLTLDTARWAGTRQPLELAVVGEASPARPFFVDATVEP